MITRLDSWKIIAYRVDITPNLTRLSSP
jgi:hypothetical protein